MVHITEKQLDTYRSLFAGRTDAYARHWEKNGRSGYSPAYDFDWHEFLAHKNRGGTMHDFEHKSLIPLCDEVLRKHLSGSAALGIYPILEDNTSNFIAADFDDAAWLTDAKSFMRCCETVRISAYLERSKSGRGGHVWIFFRKPYPCVKSRSLALKLVQHALGLSVFEKEISFDRLFPNQDYLPRGGFGNLIALPLQGGYMKDGNTLFIDPETGKPASDQWAFLENAHRHTHEELDAALAKMTGIDQIDSSTANGRDKTVRIAVGKNLRMPSGSMPPDAIHFIKERLNFLNTEYLTRKRLGKSVYNVEKYFRLVEESDGDVFLPRGFLHQLTDFFTEKRIPYTLRHEYPKMAPVDFTSTIALDPAQADALEKALSRENGVIVAPPGSGKTMIGMQIIAERKLPALVLVHRRQLLDQWVDRIETFLGIPRAQIGVFSGAKKKTGKQITVGLLQSFARYKDAHVLEEQFGTVIVDECHHIPAKTFRDAVARLNARYLYGLTATPKRKHNDEQLIFVYIGGIVARMEPAAHADGSGAPSGKPRIEIRETDLALPFEWKTDRFQLLAKILSFDTGRNTLIIYDILAQVEKGNRTLVLSERKEHLDVLALCLKGTCETILISGDDSSASRTSKLKQIRDGHYHVILSTGQFFGEGLDVKNISTLILAFPFSFEGKLAQYIGRLLHGAHPECVIDYRDKNVPFLERQFKKRNSYYRKNWGVKKLFNT